MTFKSDFQSTIWTQIQRAKQNDPRALEDFALKYRSPIVKFIIKRGIPKDHAEDIAQEVFLVIFRDNVLQKADSHKGRFRTLMLAVTDNIIKKFKTKEMTQKRGGDRLVVSLDEPQDDVLPEDLIAKEYKMDEDFDKIWAYNLAEIAFQRLKNECTKQGTPHYMILKMFIKEKADYNTIAKKLDKTVDNVKYYLHTAKSKLVDYIKDEINSYSSSRAEYKEELQHLTKFIV